MLLDMSEAPRDPVHRAMWLRELEVLLRAEMDAEMQSVLFQARLQGQFDAALNVSGLSRKVALRMTRRENTARGTAVRWGDGMSQ